MGAQPTPAYNPGRQTYASGLASISQLALPDQDFEYSTGLPTAEEIFPDHTIIGFPGPRDVFLNHVQTIGVALQKYCFSLVQCVEVTYRCPFNLNMDWKASVSVMLPITARQGLEGSVQERGQQVVPPAGNQGILPGGNQGIPPGDNQGVPPAGNQAVQSVGNQGLPPDNPAPSSSLLNAGIAGNSCRQSASEIQEMPQAASRGPSGPSQPGPQSASSGPPAVASDSQEAPQPDSCVRQLYVIHGLSSQPVVLQLPRNQQRPIMVNAHGVLDIEPPDLPPRPPPRPNQRIVSGSLDRVLPYVPPTSVLYSECVPPQSVRDPQSLDVHPADLDVPSPCPRVLAAWEKPREPKRPRWRPYMFRAPNRGEVQVST